MRTASLGVGVTEDWYFREVKLKTVDHLAVYEDQIEDHYFREAKSGTSGGCPRNCLRTLETIFVEL